MPGEVTVSVIIPCYKQAAFVGKAISSVIEQTYRQTEIIVIDDGSPDDVVAAVAPFGDRVKLIRQTNRGHSAARNAGVAAATGECVLFLDSDDYLLPHCIQSHITARALAGDPRVVSHTGVREVNLKGETIIEYEPTGMEVDPFHRLMRMNVGPPHCFVAPTSAFKTLRGFDSSLKAHEDWDLWLQFAAAGYRFVPVPGIGAIYVKHDGTVTTNIDRMYTTADQVSRRWRAHHGNCRQCRQARTVMLGRYTQRYFRGAFIPKIRQIRSIKQMSVVLIDGLQKLGRLASIDYCGYLLLAKTRDFHRRGLRAMRRLFPARPKSLGAPARPETSTVHSRSDDEPLTNVGGRG